MKAFNWVKQQWKPNRLLLLYFTSYELKQAVTTDRRIQSIQLFLESGKVMVASDVLINTYLGQKQDLWVEAIRQTKEDSLWLPTTTRINYGGHKDSVITFIRKVPVSYHEKIGYLAIHLYEDKIQEQLKQMQNIADMNMYIITSEGKLITSYKQANVGDDVTQLHIQQIVPNRADGFFTDKAHHPRTLVTYSSPLWNGWRLVLQTPLTNIYDKLSYIGNLTFGFCVMLSIIGIVISYWLSRKMYDPIKQLIERTHSYMDELSMHKTMNHSNQFSMVSDVLDVAVGQKKLRDQQFRSQVPAMLESFAIALLQQRITEHSEIQERIEMYNLGLSMRGYVVVVLEMDHADELAQRFSKKDLNLYRYAITNVVTEIIQTQSHYRFVITDISEQQIAIILNVFDLMEAEELRELLQHAQHVISDLLKLSISIGIGSVYPDITQSYDSYQEAAQVLRMKLHNGAKSLLFYEMPDKERERDYYSLMQIEKEVKNNLKLGKTVEVLEVLNKLRAEIEQKQLPAESVSMAYTRLLEGSIETLIECNGHPHDLFGTDTVLHRELTKRETIDEIHQWMAAIVTQISVYIKEQANKNNKTVEKVVAYINIYYQSDLSIEMIAEGVGFNTSYLSRMFKQHRGQTMLEYLTFKRMEESKKLLKDTTLNLHDISKAIGYNNVNSYIRFFKKMEGVTPGEFRKK